MPGAIVTTHYRYKRPPRKRAKAAAIEASAIVTARKPGKLQTRVDASDQGKAAAAPTNDDRKSAAGSSAVTQSAIVTARRPRAASSVPVGLLADTPEEHKRRGEAADALWREMVRRVHEERG